MPLPSVLRMPRSNRMVFGVPYSNWTKKHFQAHVRAMPSTNEDKLIMAELLRRIP